MQNWHGARTLNAVQCILGMLSGGVGSKVGEEIMEKKKMSDLHEAEQELPTYHRDLLLVFLLF